MVDIAIYGQSYCPWRQCHECLWMDMEMEMEPPRSLSASCPVRSQQIPRCLRLFSVKVLVIMKAANSPICNWWCRPLSRCKLPPVAVPLGRAGCAAHGRYSYTVQTRAHLDLISSGGANSSLHEVLSVSPLASGLAILHHSRRSLANCP